MVIKIENNKIVKGDVNLSSEFPNYSFPSVISQSDLPEGYYIIESMNEPVVAWDETATHDSTVEFVDGKPRVIWAVQKKSLNEITKIVENKRSELISQCEQIRKRKEYSYVTFNSHQISTSQTGQMKLMGVYLMTLQNPTFTVNWKITDGTFVELNAADIAALIQQVRDHIQYWFNWEKTTTEQINLLTTYQELLDLESQINSL